MRPFTIVCSALILLMPLQALAGLSEVVPLGKGRYMIGGRANTVFGSPGKLQAKAMKIAATYCLQKKPGSEAVMESATGQRAAQGWGAFGNGVAAGGGGQFAEVEVTFTCEAIEDAAQTTTEASGA